MNLSIDEINQLSEASFVETLGGIFEHSPWVAELVYTDSPFESAQHLLHVMVDAVRKAPEVQRMELLCQHPELAGKEASAGKLTRDSSREQAGAGLNQCSAKELTKIKSLNNSYRKKHGFPFIIAVAGLDKLQIIAAMESRAANNETVEFDTAIAEVEKIAGIRLLALVDA